MSSFEPSVGWWEDGEKRSADLCLCCSLQTGNVGSLTHLHLDSGFKERKGGGRGEGGEGEREKKKEKKRENGRKLHFAIIFFISSSCSSLISSRFH